jgi:hypothetical protein
MPTPNRTIRYAQLIGILGSLMIAFGSTFAPLFCGEYEVFFTTSDCHIGGENTLLDWRDIRDDPFQVFQDQWVSLGLLLFAYYGLRGSLQRDFIGLVFSGVGTTIIAGFMLMLLAAAMHIPKEHLFEHTEYGWAFLFGGAFLTFGSAIMLFSQEKRSTPAVAENLTID